MICKASIISTSQFNQIYTILKNGGVACLPTDTVYAITCLATSCVAVEKIYAFKNRSKKKPLPIFVANASMLHRYVIFNKFAESLMQNFWPGALTIILPKKSNTNLAAIFPNEVAVRMPNNSLILQLSYSLDHPLVATSANLSNKSESNNMKVINHTFADNVDMIVASNNNKLCKTSTIVQVSCNNQFKVIRKGAISEESMKLLRQ